MPGLYFVYEFSPLRSVIRETHLPFFELCTSLCAILGGVFTMMGMVGFGPVFHVEGGEAQVQVERVRAHAACCF